MKNIILPNNELRLLSGQLQNFNTGYTVPQIRSLDKVIRVMETTLQPFTDGLEGLLKVVVPQGNDKDRIEAENKKQEEIESYLKRDGEKIVTCPIEDVDFEFIKMVWSKMATLSGTKEAREAIIKIDDAIQGAKEPVFSNGEVPLKPVDNQKAD